MSRKEFPTPEFDDPIKLDPDSPLANKVQAHLSRRDFLKLGGTTLLAGAAALFVGERNKGNESEAAELVSIPPSVVYAKPTKTGWNFNVYRIPDKPQNWEVQVMKTPFLLVREVSSSTGERMGIVQKKYDPSHKAWVERRDVASDRILRETTMIPEWDKAEVMASGEGIHEMPDLSDNQMYVFALAKNGSFDPNTNNRWQMFTTPIRAVNGTNELTYETIIII